MLNKAFFFLSHTSYLKSVLNRLQGDISIIYHKAHAGMTCVFSQSTLSCIPLLNVLLNVFFLYT